MDHKYQRDKYWPAGVLGTEYNVLFVCENGDAMDYLRNAFKKFALNRHFGILAVRDGPKDSYNYEDIFNHLRPITRQDVQVTPYRKVYIATDPNPSGFNIAAQIVEWFLIYEPNLVTQCAVEMLKWSESCLKAGRNDLQNIPPHLFHDMLRELVSHHVTITYDRDTEQGLVNEGNEFDFKAKDVDICEWERSISATQFLQYCHSIYFRYSVENHQFNVIDGMNAMRRILVWQLIIERPLEIDMKHYGSHVAIAQDCTHIDNESLSKILREFGSLSWSLPLTSSEVVHLSEGSSRGNKSQLQLYVNVLFPKSINPRDKTCPNVLYPVIPTIGTFCCQLNDTDTNIPTFLPSHLITMVRDKLNGNATTSRVPMPWQRGFKGFIRSNADNTQHKLHGRYVLEVVNGNTLLVRIIAIPDATKRQLYVDTLTDSHPDWTVTDLSTDCQCDIEIAMDAVHIMGEDRSAWDNWEMADLLHLSHGQWSKKYSYMGFCNDATELLVDFGCFEKMFDKWFDQMLKRYGERKDLFLRDLNLFESVFKATVPEADRTEVYKLDNSVCCRPCVIQPNGRYGLDVILSDGEIDPIIREWISFRQNKQQSEGYGPTEEEIVVHAVTDDQEIEQNCGEEELYHISMKNIE